MSSLVVANVEPELFPPSNGVDPNESELERVRAEITEKEKERKDLLNKALDESNEKKLQILDDARKAVEADLATFRDTEKELVLRSTAPP